MLDNPFDSPNQTQPQYDNPFDDPSVTTNTQANDYGNDSYVVETKAKPAPPPPRPPAQPTQKLDQIDGSGYGMEGVPVAPNKPVDTSTFATMEVKDDDISDLQRSCFGYDPMMRIWATGGGVAFLVAGVVGVISSAVSLDVIRIISSVYLAIIGFWILAVEIPPNLCCGFNKGMQNRVFRWARLMRRYWGRAMLYLFFSLLCLSDKDSDVKVAMGAVVMFICFLMWIVSFISAGAARQMYTYITDGTEGDEARARWEHAFHEIARHKDSLTADDLQMLVRLSGRWMNGSERFTVLRYFDEFISNDISLKEWMMGMEGLQRGVRWL